MGRYYNGDIEGKFWFGLQSSDDASFFGGTINEPHTINYTFDKETDYKTVVEGIAKCKKVLGKYKVKLDKFFSTNLNYNDKKVAKSLKIKEAQALKLIEYYARLELGEKIKKCLDKQEYCDFEAEL